jgi:hypothetical protein
MGSPQPAEGRSDRGPLRLDYPYFLYLSFLTPLVGIMSMSAALSGTAHTAAPLATLVNPHSKATGGIQRLDHSRAVVLADDSRKSQLGETLTAGS